MTRLSQRSGGLTGSLIGLIDDMELINPIFLGNGGGSGGVFSDGFGSGLHSNSFLWRDLMDYVDFLNIFLVKIFLKIY